MPVFLVNTPDGRHIRVNAPDGATQEDAFAYVDSNFPAPVKQEGSAIGYGLKQLGAGAIDVASLPGKAMEMVPNDTVSQFGKSWVDVTNQQAKDIEENIPKEMKERGQLLRQNPDTGKTELNLNTLSVVGTALRGVPSVVPLIALSEGLGGGKQGFGAAGAILGAPENFDKNYREAIASGASETEARKRAYIATTLSAPVDFAANATVPGLTKFATGKAKGLALKTLAGAGVGGAPLALQTAADEAISNLTQGKEVDFEDIGRKAVASYIGSLPLGAGLTLKGAHEELKTELANQKAQSDKAQEEHRKNQRERGTDLLPETQREVDRRLGLQRRAQEGDQPLQPQSIADQKLGLTTPEDLSVDQAIELSKLEQQRKEHALEEAKFKAQQDAVNQSRVAGESIAAETGLEEKPPEVIRQSDENEANRSYQKMKEDAAQRKVDEAEANKGLEEVKTKAALIKAAKKPQEGIDQQDYEETVQAVKDEHTPDELASVDFAHEEDNNSPVVKNPVKRNRVRVFAQSLLDKLAVRPKLNVFDDFNDVRQVPASVRAEANRRGITNPKAFKVGNTIYLNSSKLHTKADIIEHVEHEGTGHIGVQLYHNGHLDEVFNDVAKERPDEMNALASRHNYDINSRYGKNKAAGEILAVLAQKNRQHPLVIKAISLVRRGLRKLGLVKRMSDTEIVDKYILPVRQFMETGSKNPAFKGMSNETLKLERQGDILDHDMTPVNQTARRNQHNKRIQEITDELQARHKMLSPEGIDFAARQSNRELYRIRADLQWEKDHDQHITPEREKQIEKHLEEIDDEIHQNSVEHMKTMAKSKKKLTDYKPDFSHDEEDKEKTRLTEVPKKEMPKTTEPSTLTTEEAQQFNEEPNTPDNFPAKLKPEHREASNEEDDKTSFAHDEGNDEEDPRSALDPIVTAAKKGYRGIIKSVADTLKEIKLPDLGKGIVNLVDYAQRNRGMIQKFTVPALDKVLKSGNKKAIIQDFNKLYQAEQNRTTYNPEHSETTDLMTSMRQALEAVGKKMSDLGMMANIDGKKVPFKMRKDFLPAILKPEFRSAIYNSMEETGNGWDFTPEFKKIAKVVIDKGLAKDLQGAREFFKEKINEGGFESGFWGDMGMKQELPFPIEFYDNTLDSLRMYLDRASERLAQVEAFTIKDAKGKNIDMFDKTLNDLDIDDPRYAYVSSIKRMVYNDRFNKTTLEKTAQTLNTLATGLQLSGPKSGITNFLGGISNIMAFTDSSASLKAFHEYYNTEAKKAIEDIANNLGITSDDAFRILSDYEAGGLFKYSGARAVSRGAALVSHELMSLKRFGPLSKASFNSTENTVRILSTMAAKHQLAEWITHYKNNGLDARSKVFEKFCQDEGIDMNKIMEETPESAKNNTSETARFYRRFVNRLQGSYRLDQVPRFLDTSWGRFLFKYTKYGFQLGRMFDKQVVQNLANPATRSEGAKNLVKYFAVFSAMGTFNAALVNIVFGDKKIPSKKEFSKVLSEKLEKDTTGAGMYALYNIGAAMNLLGAFGPLSIGKQYYDEFTKYGETPLNTPGLGVINNLAGTVGKWLFSGNQADSDSALNDLQDIVTKNVGFAGQYSQALGERLEPSNILHAKRVIARSRAAVERYTEATGDIEEPSVTDAIKNVKYPILTPLLSGQNKVLKDDVYNALLTGNSEAARAVYTRVMDRAKAGHMTKAEEGNYKTTIANSVLARRPFGVHGKLQGGASSDLAKTKKFMDWASTHMDPQEYQEIKDLDDRYMQAAVDAGLISKDKMKEASYNKAVLNYEKGMREAK